ncbi:hypothetical protein BYT27DRAFT_7253762 [Phlegmacium glaucopus]|nr:hypothetical protein BYT27DRAFT_7253762 [Phlegmacium glaucopus]
MFFKYVSLLIFAASAIAGTITPGTYQIVNVASDSAARAYDGPGLVFVSSYRDLAGWFELWDISDAKDGGYTIANVGLNMIYMLDTSAAVFSPDNGELQLIRTSLAPTVFNIESAGNGEYVIKLPNEDLLWNAEPPVVPYGDVKLRPANGDSTEHWRLIPARAPGSAHASPNHNYDRWDLPVQRIPGRFLGQV